MLKPISFILLTTLTLLALHPTKIILKNFCPYLIDQLIRSFNLQNDQYPADLSLQNLQELTSIPVIGNLFIQKKVKKLINQRLWKDVLEQCQKNQKSILVPSTSLLPLRAVAQCATYQFTKCQQTMNELQSIAPHLLQSISHLYRIYRKEKQLRIDEQTQRQSIKISQI